MNPSQKEYISRINKVIDYVEAHLDEELSLEVLSEVANFSPYHFHRIYSAFMGETLMGFVKRKRIEKAASIINKEPETPISNIAYACGYNSVSVFCRNFKDRYGMTAQEFRAGAKERDSKNRQLDSNFGKWDPLKDGYVCNVESLKQRSMKITNDITVKEMPEMHLVYYRHTGEFHLIGKAYEKLFTWAGPRGILNQNTKTITVYHDDPSVTEIENVRQSAGILVDKDVKGEGEFGTMSVPAGKYIVGSFEIDVTEFKQAWDSVCIALSESGYQPSDGMPYELYHCDPENHPEKKFVLDICIPVKPL